MDYKHRIPGYRPPRPRRKKNSTGRWVALALVGGLGIGAIGWMVIHRGDEGKSDQLPDQSDASPVALPSPPAKTDGGKTAKPEAKETIKPAPDNRNKPVDLPAKKEPRFTFYKILPEKEAIIPESEIKSLKHEESLGKKPPMQYMLQAGSFSNGQDAEKLKARLSSLKIRSHVENVKIDNSSWSRVKIGPFSSLADADRVRLYLRNNQIDSVVQKAVGGGQKPAGR